mgnify:CR=1 FL=1
MSSCCGKTYFGNIRTEKSVLIAEVGKTTIKEWTNN